VTDRWSAYDWIAGASRQICWSHLPAISRR
jgi:hypothetical protein